MGETLFLAHRIPFPPDRGDKIRSHHLLKGLAGQGPVHVGTFAENAADRAQEAELSGMAASYCLPTRAKPLPLAGVEAVLKGKPVSLTAFESAGLRKWVAHTIATRRIDTIVVFSGQMGQYIPEAFGGRVIIDLCDVDSAKFEGYADAGQRVWVNRREGRLLRLEEARLAGRADVTLLISDNEAELFRSRLGEEQTADIRVLGNGIDVALFDPASVEPQPELAMSEGPHFVFTGQMDYPPNEQAALWVMESLMPTVTQSCPGAMFHVVGRAPTAALKQRGEDLAHTRVWGEVPDTRPFLVAADVVLAPLKIARGVQNKVLEAMAMARPVMVTPEAATGIGALDGQHFGIAPPDASVMADRLLRLVADPTAAKAMGDAARAFVSDRMSWEAVYATLQEIVRPDTGTRDAA